MKKLVIGVIVLAIAVAGFITYTLATRQPVKKAAQTQMQKKELHPLFIEAIRARNYPGSEITAEQQLGNRGGYIDSIVSYRSDELKIYALMSVPVSPAPAGGYPVIILDHGYIVPSDYRTDGPEYKSWIAYFAKAGYVVIKPDYRGHGNSEGSPDGGHYSPVYAYDNLNLIASLKKFDLVNGDRIGILGHSLGAHVSLRTMVVSPDVKATVVASGVVGSFNDLFFNWPRLPYRNDQPTGLIRSSLQQLIDDHGDPKSNPEFWDQATSLNYLAAVKGPVQIHVGSADTTVPPLFSQHLHEALDKAAKPNQLFMYEGGDHQFTNDRALFLQRSLEFFNKNL